MFAQDALTEQFALYKLHCFNPAYPASSQREPADAAEGVKETERHSPCLLASLAWYTRSAQPRL
jgi:hypothetical protein